MTDAFLDHLEETFPLFPPCSLRNITRYIADVTRTVDEAQNDILHDTAIMTRKLDPDSHLIAPFSHYEIRALLKKTKKRAPGLAE